MRAVLLLIAVVMGCGKSQPTPDRKGDEYRAKVAQFVAECRAFAKLLAVLPTAAEAEQAAARVKQLYVRLPDPPEDAYDSADRSLLKTCLTMLESRVQSAALSVGSRDETRDDLLKLAAEIGKWADLASETARLKS